MRLVYVANTVVPSFSAHSVQIMKMCEAFSTKCTTTLLTFGGGSKQDVYDAYDVSTFALQLLKPSGNYVWRELVLLFAALGCKADVYYTRSLLFAYLMSFFGRKVVYELHEMHSNKLWRFILRRFIFRTRFVVVISRGLLKALCGIGIPIEYIHVSADAVDTSAYGVSKESARKKLGLGKGKIVLYSGSFKVWKGVDLLLQSFAASGSTRTRLFVVGGQDHEIQAYKKLYPDVVFVGHVSQKLVPLYLQAADYLVLPNVPVSATSTHYTSPLKLFEYMASGRPILCSDLPSLREVVSEKHVHFFDPSNPGTLRMLFEHIDSGSLRDGKRAEHALTLVKKYTWTGRAQRLLKTIKKV